MAGLFDMNRIMGKSGARGDPWTDSRAASLSPFGGAGVKWEGPDARLATSLPRVSFGQGVPTPGPVAPPSSRPRPIPSPLPLPTLDMGQRPRPTPGPSPFPVPSPVPMPLPGSRPNPNSVPLPPTAPDPNSYPHQMQPLDPNILMGILSWLASHPALGQGGASLAPYQSADIQSTLNQIRSMIPEAWLPQIRAQFIQTPYKL